MGAQTSPRLFRALDSCVLFLFTLRFLHLAWSFYCGAHIVVLLLILPLPPPASPRSFVFLSSCYSAVVIVIGIVGIFIGSSIRSRLLLVGALCYVCVSLRWSFLSLVLLHVAVLSSSFFIFLPSFFLLPLLPLLLETLY